jgi:hypothetical protein
MKSNLERMIANGVRLSCAASNTILFQCGVKCWRRLFSIRHSVYGASAAGHKFALAGVICAAEPTTCRAAIALTRYAPQSLAAGLLAAPMPTR